MISKKEKVSAFVLTILLFAFVPFSSFAAVLDVQSPYDGDYLLTIHTGTDTAATQSTGILPSGESEPAGVNALQSSEETVENGLVMQQADPRSFLERMREPEQSTGLQKSAYSSVLEIMPYIVGDTKNFYTANLVTNKYESKTFVLQHSGTKCNIWLEQNSTVALTQSNIATLGSEFDNNIYANMAEHFGTASDPNGDGKVAILLYDIQDGWDGSSQTWYVGGFFDSYDITGRRLDVLHMDTYPLMGTNQASPSVLNAKDTIAHEYQHLINFSYSSNGSNSMPVWMDEGLAMAAEHMLYGVQSSRISYFNRSTVIRDGQSLFDWNSSDGNLSNYSLAYLLMQYLRTQTKGFSGGGTDLYKTLIQGSDRGTNAVQTVMRQFYPNITLDDIMVNFRIATLLKEPFGAHGFMGESDFASVSPLLYTGSQTNLIAGGAVMKRITSTALPTGGGTDIKYVAFRHSPFTAGLYQSGTQLGSLPDTAGTYTIKAQFQNETGGTQIVTFVAAVKTGGQLTQLKTQAVQASFGAAGEFACDLILPSSQDAPDLQVQLMAWDGSGTLRPLENSISFSRN